MENTDWTTGFWTGEIWLAYEYVREPSCVAGYKLIGSEDGKKAAILAADQLITRFHEKGEFLQAWGL